MIVPHQLRAPREDRAVVAVPPLAEAGRLLAANRALLSRTELDLLGRPWTELRRQARQAAMSAAQEYLHRGGEPVPAVNSDSLVMAGHQPELFHPGVWMKNFALNGLAQAHAATPVNLVVDNDIAKTTTCRVPTGEATTQPIGPASVRAGILPFDYGTEEVPYEERTVHDEAVFAGFGERAIAALAGWDYVPLLTGYWSEVLRQAQRTNLLGERLAAARRTLERRWGCHNLELPVSLLCQTEPFAWFACHLLANLPRFHAVYNACVHDYRSRYGIRSRHHPVPDLVAEDDWREVPFWAWRAGQTRRGRLMAQVTEAGVKLRVGKEDWPTLPLSTERAVAAWQDLERSGFKVRSRALTNTMFARLFLTDLFVHGIGGGKYDELTDEIIRRFHGIEPPGYLVLSGTLLLPLPTFPARQENMRRLARGLRDTHYNPQRHLENGTRSVPSVRELAEQKQAWIARQPTAAHQRRERFQVLRALTDQLRGSLDKRLQELQTDAARCEQELQANAVLQRRDYAFCLYPEALLRPFCTQFLR